MLECIALRCNYFTPLTGNNVIFLSSSDFRRLILSPPALLDVSLNECALQESLSLLRWEAWDFINHTSFPLSVSNLILRGVLEARTVWCWVLKGMYYPHCMCTVVPRVLESVTMPCCLEGWASDTVLKKAPRWQQELAVMPLSARWVYNAWQDTLSQYLRTHKCIIFLLF